MNINNMVNYLAGYRVSNIRIYKNIIKLYFNNQFKRHDLLTLKLYPFWRYERNGKYLLGSSDFPKNQEGEIINDKNCVEIKSICELLNKLVGLEILNFKIDDSSHDILIEFESNQILRSFAAESREALWCIKDNREKLDLIAFVNKIIEKKGAKRKEKRIGQDTLR